MNTTFVSFGKLRRACLTRWKEWMGTEPCAADLVYTTNELAGETGEACNVAKKIERTRRGVVGGLDAPKGHAKLSEELADVVICAQNSALMYRIDLAAAVVEKFNRTSIEKGLVTMFDPGDRDGVELIAEERSRQINGEGWAPEHDDKHSTGDLAKAAAAYAVPASHRNYTPGNDSPDLWPWGDEWWKPCEDRVRELVKAGALIAAEIDRLQRATAKTPRAGA